MNIVRENGVTTMSRYNVGDIVYLVKTVQVTELCNYCGGIGVVENNLCPICKGYNTVDRMVYVPITTPAKIIEIKVSVKEDDEVFKYIIEVNHQRYNRTFDKIFNSFEEAMRYCAKKNVRKIRMKIEDIKIPNGFLKTYPCPEKIEKRMQELRATGNFENMIEVDENGKLVDGYTTYVLAKGFGWKEIEVIVHTK